ncbi:HlyD family type I secretion periplasmic adaptor subunit [Notoacmeibacter sp. MSK16QG-6]|nr:HlyD family type I secretion periplasmic adaptor subunit [Notoacmeibacter sp. MSK16QG-6]
MANTSRTSHHEWQDQVPVRRGWFAALGYGFLVLLLATFGYWGATAPISGAAIAPGVIAASGRNVAIQHLEGGIVQKLPVEEGDQVEAGDIVLRLDPTLARTKLRRLTNQWETNEAMIVRLVAERDGLDAMPNDADKPETDAIAEIRSEQRKEFQARLSRYASEQEILKQRVAAYEEAREGLIAQRDAVDAQLEIVADELERKKSLVDKGLTNHFEYTQIQRNKADLIGRRSVILSELATNQTNRIEALEQRERLATQRVEETVTRLNEVRAAQVDIGDQLEDARFILSRTDVRAPVGGIVVASHFNAIGSVVPPGGTIMDILPTSEGVVVEARLRPQDVDVVQLGQEARLRLSALNMRVTPEVEGTVIHISADRLVDEATQEPYYLTRLKMTDDLPPPVTRDQLYPGMPVEALISTGERTFFEYLAKPILDSFSHAFTED